MEKFGHYFEFFAAVNSAYIVSNLFLEKIITEIYNHFSNIGDHLNSLKKIQENNEKVLFTEYNTDLASVNPDISDRLTKRTVTIKQKFEEFSATLEQSRKQASISKNFNFLCLYSAFYCISILIANGFEYEFHTSMSRGCFFIFNIASIVTLLWLFWEKKKIFLRRVKATHTSVLLTFLVVIVISCPIYHLVQWIFPSNYYGSQYGLINTILSLIFPASHFFYFFVRASNKSKKESRRLSTDLAEIVGECNAFKLEMDTTFTVIKDVKKTKE